MTRRGLDRWPAPLAAWWQALWRSYAMVFFVGDWRLAMAFFLASFCFPVAGLMGLIGVAATNAAALALGLDRDQIKAGLYGLNGLLVGLAVGWWYGLGWTPLLLVVVGALAVAIVAAGAYHWFGQIHNLPVLSLPFVAVAALIQAAQTALVGPRVTSPPPALFDLPPDLLPTWLAEYLHALAAIFFQPSLIAGLFVLLGLLAVSRVMVFLTVVGFASGQALAWALGLGATALAPHIWGFNLILVAVAVGGIFFVPSLRAFLGAALAACLGLVLSLALGSLFASTPLAVLAWPFNLTVIMFVLAARARTEPAEPRVVDFVPDTPERNLEYHRSRLRRYRGLSVPVFRLPLWGRFLVSQGPDEQPTHRGAWRQAWDFVGTDYSGRTFRGDGSLLEDHLAYGRDVLAGAGGRVVRVVNDVPDNPVGLENIARRWGNMVVLWHAGGIYTVYAHLIPGSIVVAEGQPVLEGQLLGRLGNSGRSTDPHLHFQCQRSPEMASPTVYAELVGYIQPVGSGRHYHFTGRHQGGAVLEDPMPNAEFGAALHFPLGRRIDFEVKHRRRSWAETWEVRSDLIAGSYLYETGKGAKLFFASDGRSFFATDYLGPRDRGLHAFFLACSRVPYCFEPSLTWDDVLSPRT
ncbi:MAG: urea transporter, partial [Proteobacteria bacterium]|nr:urea transporter [Pseudomonadota bacterium]